jgi:hypothetical protein
MGPADAGGDAGQNDSGVLLMAFLLEVHIIDPGDDTIKVTHQFWGLTEREVLTYKREHLSSCEYFREAEKAGNTIEELEEIDEEELPDPEDFEAA